MSPPAPHRVEVDGAGEPVARAWIGLDAVPRDLHAASGAGSAHPDREVVPRHGHALPSMSKIGVALRPHRPSHRPPRSSKVTIASDFEASDRRRSSTPRPDVVRPSPCSICSRVCAIRSLSSPSNAPTRQSPVSSLLSIMKPTFTLETETGTGGTERRRRCGRHSIFVDGIASSHNRNAPTKALSFAPSRAFGGKPSRFFRVSAAEHYVVGLAERRQSIARLFRLTAFSHFFLPSRTRPRSPT